MKVEVVERAGDPEIEAVCSAPINMPTNKATILVRKLVLALNQFEHFRGNAALMELPRTPAKKGIQSTIDVTPLHPGSFIEYRCPFFLPGATALQKEALGEEFKKECRNIHRKVEEIVGKYQVENKP